MGFFGLIRSTLHVVFLLIFDPIKTLFRCCFPKFKKSIKGEIVLITGTGHGLGKELAAKLADLGPTLVLWDVNEENNEAVANQLRRSGHMVYSYKVDVTNSQEVIEVANQVKKDVGDVSLIINNAGVFSGDVIENISEQQIRLCFEVNVMAHFWILKQFLPRMLELNKGHIVSVSSAAGHFGSAYMTNYCSSKFGAVGLMKALYMELKARGKNIKLTTISPIIINTGLISNPKTRFPALLPLMDVDATADTIIKGILTEAADVFIPKRLQCFICTMRCYSRSAAADLYNYVGYGFDPPKRGADNPVMSV